MKIKFSQFINESISKPELKYPVDKCLNISKFFTSIESQGVDIYNIPIKPHGPKQFRRTTGNFYTIFEKLDPIFPKMSRWELYDETQRIQNKKYGIPHHSQKYSEYDAIYELPIKYDSSNDYADWVEKKVKFKNSMSIMHKLRGKIWTDKDDEIYDDNVDFGPESFDWYNIVLNKLHDMYPQYYKNGNIKIWIDREGDFIGKEMWDYPLNKSYFLSDLEKWLEDTFDIDTTGLYKWILDNHFIEERYWDNVWYYGINDKSYNGIKAKENIIQINEIFRQIFKTDSIDIFIDYYKEYNY